jgi:hypothetical protein
MMQDYGLCRTGLLKMVVRDMEKCKLELVDMQEVRWYKGGTEWVED